MSCGPTQVAIDDGGWRCADLVVTRGVVGSTNRTVEDETFDHDPGEYSSVAIGTDGNPVISHHDDTNGDLELYVCDNPTCTSGTNFSIATLGDAGEYSSLAIDTSGNAVIGHSNFSVDLEVAYVVLAVTGIGFQ